MIGDTAKLPKATFEALGKVESLTKLTTGLVLTLPLNYGGRYEINQAQPIAQDVLDAKLSPGDIEEAIGNHHTSNLPKMLRDPDLVIRPVESCAQ